MSRPVAVIQVVSTTMLARRYRWPAGTVDPGGATRKRPAPRSSSVPNPLGESMAGRHSHSTFPVGAMRAATSPSDRNARSPIGGKCAVDVVAPAGSLDDASSAARLSGPAFATIMDGDAHPPGA